MAAASHPGPEGLKPWESRGCRWSEREASGFSFLLSHLAPRDDADFVLLCFPVSEQDLNWRAETRFLPGLSPWELLCAVLSQAGCPVSTFLRNRVKSPLGCLRACAVTPGLSQVSETHASRLMQTVICLINWISRLSSFLCGICPPGGQGGWRFCKSGQVSFEPSETLL